MTIQEVKNTIRDFDGNGELSLSLIESNGDQSVIWLSILPSGEVRTETQRYSEDSSRDFDGCCVEHVDLPTAKQTLLQLVSTAAPYYLDIFTEINPN